MTKSIIKKIGAATILIIATFALSGCFNFGSLFGGGPSKTAVVADDKNKLYENSDFSVKIPKDWEIIEPKDFTSEVPRETQVVFRNNVKNETFTANVTIIKNGLQTPMPSLEYAKMVINRQKLGLIDYKESSKDDYKVSVSGKDDPTFFTKFEAKKGADEKVLKTLTQLLAPFAPHITEELWHEYFKESGSIHTSSWPKYDDKYLVEDNITIIIQEYYFIIIMFLEEVSGEV